MKKIPLLLILFGILVSAGLQAQNYQTVNSGRIAYFNTAEYIQFLRIDSVIYNGDSVFYPNRVVALISSESDYPRCYSPYQPSWAGSKIVVKDDGTNNFFNRDNDSIVIKTRANLDDNWIAYKKGDSILIKAEIVTCDTAVVLGLVDSIKTIQFQVFDSIGERLDHPYNNTTVEISKNFGLVKAPNFNYFPTLPSENYLIKQYTSFSLVGMDNPKLGIQNLTWFEVFDFQPGDILHVLNIDRQCWDNGFVMNRMTSLTYLNRYDYKDSIVYHVEKKQKDSLNKNGKITESFLCDTIKEVIIANPRFDRLSNEAIVEEYEVRRIHQSVQNGYILKTYNQDGICRLRDYCWKEVNYDGGGPSHFYKGLGGYYFEHYAIDGCSNDESKLVYYKKGNITWGTPFDFTGVVTLANANIIKVYPNPASDKIVVETNSYNDPVTFELFSSGGNLFFRQIIHSAKQDINASSLKNGIYFYKVSISGQILKNGKITILH